MKPKKFLYSYIPHRSRDGGEMPCFSTAYHKVFIDGKEYLECRACTVAVLKKEKLYRSTSDKA